MIIGMHAEHSSKEPDARRLNETSSLGKYRLRLVPPPPAIVQHTNGAPFTIGATLELDNNAAVSRLKRASRRIAILFKATDKLDFVTNLRRDSR